MPGRVLGYSVVVQFLNARVHSKVPVLHRVQGMPVAPAAVLQGEGRAASGPCTQRASIPRVPEHLDRVLRWGGIQDLARVRVAQAAQVARRE